MADTATDIDLDSVIDRLLEGEWRMHDSLSVRPWSLVKMAPQVPLRVGRWFLWKRSDLVVAGRRAVGMFFIPQHYLSGELCPRKNFALGWDQCPTPFPFIVVAGPWVPVCMTCQPLLIDIPSQCAGTDLANLFNYKSTRSNISARKHARSS